MEPISLALGAGLTAKQLIGGIVDRWGSAKSLQLDERAMLRLLLLESRRNLAVLDVAIGRREPLSTKALWLVPAVLQTDALEAVLGQGKAEARSFEKLKKLVVGDDASVAQSSSALANVYVRITAMQSLSAINGEAPLGRVQIKQRLTNLQKDLLKIVVALAGKV
mgnify:CR=1 FL=1